MVSALGRKKKANWDCLWRSWIVGLATKKLKSAISTVFKELKKTMSKELKYGESVLPKETTTNEREITWKRMKSKF